MAKLKIQDLNLAHKVFPFPLVKLWMSELELYEKGIIPEFHTVKTINRDALSDILLQYVVPNEAEPAAYDKGWALSWLAFTGLSANTEVIARNMHWLPDTLTDWQAPDTHCPFGGEFGAPLYSTAAHLRYFAKLAFESPSARRQCKDVVAPDAPENKTIIVLDVVGEPDEGIVTMDFWLPKPVMQAMGYAALKNPTLGPWYRPLAENRDAEKASADFVADVFARLEIDRDARKLGDDETLCAMGGYRQLR